MVDGPFNEADVGCYTKYFNPFFTGDVYLQSCEAVFVWSIDDRDCSKGRRPWPWGPEHLRSALYPITLPSIDPDELGLTGVCTSF